MGERFTVISKAGEGNNNTAKEEKPRFTVISKANSNSEKSILPSPTEMFKKMTLSPDPAVKQAVSAAQNGKSFASPNILAQNVYSINKQYVGNSDTSKKNLFQQAVGNNTQKYNISYDVIKGKLKRGEGLTSAERKIVTDFGVKEFIGGDTQLLFDINVQKNSEKTKKIIDKKNSGKKLTSAEEDILETAKLVNPAVMEINNDMVKLTDNPNTNKLNQNLLKAQTLYKNTAYTPNNVKMGEKEIKLPNTASSFEKKIIQSGNKLDLYLGSGIEQYASGIGTTIDLIAGKSNKEIADRTSGAYTIAGSVLSQHYTETGKDFDKAIQDIVTNMAQNAIPMAAGMGLGAVGVSSTAANIVSQAGTFAPSIFGNAYKEGLDLGVTDTSKLLTYAFTTTAAETTLGIALNNMPGLKGVISENAAVNLTKNIINPIASWAIKTAIGGGGEFLEESIQEILSPLMQKYILGADVDTIISDPLGQLSNAAYAGFIGFASSVLMSGGMDAVSAKAESNLKKYGQHYLDILGKNNIDIKNIATYITEITEKETTANKMAELVKNGDTSAYSVGVMINELAQLSDNGMKTMYEAVGREITKNPQELQELISGYKSLVKEGYIFPEKVDALFEQVKGEFETKESVSDSLAGEFAINVQIYSPRALIMGQAVKNIDSTVRTNEITNLEDEDVAEFEETKRHHTTQAEQNYIKSVCEDLGVKIVFEDMYKKARELGVGWQQMPDAYIDENGVIHMGFTTTDPIALVLKHELSHYAESSNKYADFVKAVKTSKVYENWISEKVSGNDNIAVKSAKYRQSIIDGYAVNGVKLTPVQAENEVVANFVAENLFSEDGSGLKAITNEMTSANRKTFLDYIKNFVEYLKSKLSGNKTASRKIRKLENMFNEVLSSVEQKNTADNSGVRYSFDEVDRKEEIIDISGDNELSEKVGELRGAKKYKIIQKYVLELFAGEKIKLSDGKIAIVDNSDALHIANKSANKKTAEISNLKQIIEKATLYAEDKNVEHNKFDYFCYYRVMVKFGKDIFPIYLNVGKAINNGEYHIYDITQTIRDTADRINGLERPKPNEGYALRNGISTDFTIPQDNSKSQEYSMQKSKNHSKKQFSIPIDQASLLDKYENGEITREEYLEETDKNWTDALNEYGAIETGENPTLNVSVPKAVEEGKNTRRFSRTIIESGEITADMLEEFSTEILLGNFSYKPISDETAQAKAEKTIADKQGKNAWNEAVYSSKYVSKEQIAVGEKLLLEAIDAKDTKRVLELSAELSEVLTRSGQVVQAARMLKKMSGVGKLMAVQKSVDSINRDLKVKYKDKAPTVKLNELIAEQLAETQIGEDIESIYEDALGDIAAQVPATFLDKWNAWRYMSMLTNPTTHIRNIVGNAIFTPSARLKDLVSAGLETAFIEENKRTKVIFIDKKYKDFAENDLKNSAVKTALSSGGKFNAETKISEKQQIFKNKVLEFIRVGNGNLLEAEDLLFKNRHYKHALAGFLQARNVNLKTVSDEVLWQARTYAVNEAMKATFNDANKLSTALSSAARNNKYMDVAINGILPFKKTPINIVRRGVEYSPIGLISALTKGTYDLKNGKITATEYIDGIGAGISGSVVFAVGMLLSSLGWVTGGFGDDKEDEFKKLNGEQEYALQLFGKSYTVDWAAPACIPFFIGVELVNALKEDKEDFKLSDITDTMWNSLEPVINLSMLSGVQSMIESVKYATEDRSVISFAGNIAKSYFSQGLPTIFGKVARTIDDKRRSNYVDRNSQLSPYAQGIVNTVKSKVPFLENKKPEYVNAWGQTESNGNLFERIFGNFISPGYYSEINSDELSQELMRLNETVDGVNVFPKSADKSFEVDGATKYLTANEYVKYAKAKGQYSLKFIDEFINCRQYESLTDEERAKVIENLYKYANAKAKAEVSDYDITKQFKSVSNWEKRGKSPVIYYIGRALAD